MMKINNINPWLVNFIVLILIAIISYYSNPKIESQKEVSRMITGKHIFNSSMRVRYNYFNSNTKEEQAVKK